MRTAHALPLASGVLASSLALFGVACGGRDQLFSPYEEAGGWGGTATTSHTTSHSTTTTTTGGGGAPTCNELLSSFTAPVPGTEAYDLDVGDLNGDGRPDLLVGADDATVLLHQGWAAFSAVGYDDGYGSSAVVAGQIDDGAPLDIVAADGARLHVWRGLGGGTFAVQAGYDYDVEDYTQSMDVIVGQLDSDDEPDVAITDLGGWVTFLPGAGDGILGVPVTWHFDGAPQRMAVADLDGDAPPEIAVAEYGTGTVWVMWPTGVLTDYYLEPVYVGGLPRQPAFGDLDGNGELDLVVAGEQQGVSVFLRASQQFLPGIVYDLAGTESVAVTDFDRDGALDLLVAGHGLTLLRGRGDGTFEPAITCPLPGKGHTVVTADFDVDGWQDVAVITLGNQATELFVALGAGL